jgi:hypothetical protein
MRRLRHTPAAEAWGLLRVLLLRFGAVPSDPGKLLLLDEPTLGLSPRVAHERHP